MNNTALLSSPVAESHTQSLPLIEAPLATDLRSQEGGERVGHDLQAMTDPEREEAARRAGAAMEAWYSHYRQTGDPRFLDVAYSCLGMMRALLAGRSTEYVAKLEAERGLR